MKTVRTRLYEIRTSEAGMTLAELLVAIFLLGIITIGYVAATLGTHNAVNDFANKELGQAQGDAMDTAREITEVAFLWVASHSTAGMETTFTKEDLVTFSECDRAAVIAVPNPECDPKPYLDPIPETYVWGAGNYPGSLQNMCAVVYERDASADSENARYSAENPAMWERVAKNKTYVNACNPRDEAGNNVPNFGEVTIGSRFND